MANDKLGRPTKERIAVLRKEEMNANSWNEMGALLLHFALFRAAFFQDSP